MSYSVDQRSRVLFCCPEYPRFDSGAAAAVDMDQESCGSSTEEVESPRSVVVAAAEIRGRKSGGDRVHAHSQVLRIRAEDLNLRDDVGEGRLNKLGFGDFVIITRPIPRASPLGGKTDGH
ncbi:hypothetical protein F511_42381 [Dorcoceras hygrometricum]|uniref:Uncharacterized protein n=1 Tax=Dorcoceras hygrometricum TaxID=472368 RepID=A0A2Z6ZZI7_9LAMI|nr:hypothetical protein F511_42381 [Dorcoceras hygrometricum]